MRQRATMAILAALVALPAFAAAFPDVPAQHWAKDAVNAATSGAQPFMAGISGKFQGNQAASHADVVKAFNQMLIHIAKNTTVTFDPNALKTNNPGWNSVKDGSAKPLTRYELAGILSGLYSQADAKGIVEKKTSTIKFSDTAKAPAWAKEAIENTVNKYGVLKGYPDGKFHGEKPVSRYELAALSNMVAKSDWRPLKDRVQPTPAPTATPKPQPTATPKPAPTPMPTPTPLTFPAYRLDANVFGIPGLNPVVIPAPATAPSAGTTAGIFGTPAQLAGTFKGRQDIPAGPGGFFIGERVSALPGIYTQSVLSADAALQLGWNFTAGDNVRFRPFISGGAIYNTMLGQSAATGFTGRDTLIPDFGYGLVFDWKPINWFGLTLDLANRHTFGAMNLGGATGVLPANFANLPLGNLYLDFYPFGTDNFGIGIGYGLIATPDLTGTGNTLTLQHGPQLGLNLAF